MKSVVSCEDRLKKMMVNDESYNTNISRLIKAELIYVLKNYFDIISDNVSVDISISDIGKYQINISAVSDGAKVAHLF